MFSEDTRHWRTLIIRNVNASSALEGQIPSERMKRVQQQWIDNLITSGEMREIVFEWYGLDEK